MKIALLGCKGTTLDLLCNLGQHGKVKISQVITLSEENASKNKVAFYQGKQILEYCKNYTIPHHITETYHMNHEDDLFFFQQNKFDLLIVLGWERLVPSSILQCLGKFSCGMHGSAYGLPKGRGRSPLNWSILTGHRKFITYLFKYDPFIDAGEIIGLKAFDINEFDTISSLHYKNSVVMQQLLETYVPLIEKNQIVFYPQPPLNPSFYPKRTDEDGAIDWYQKTDEIYDLIRAVSEPYPSAFTFLKNKKLIITTAFPFDTALFDSNIKPGTIMDVSISLDQFVVKTSSGSLLVTKFSGCSSLELQIGEVLESVNENEILNRIIERYAIGTKEEEKEIRQNNIL
jgi:methionyl-tRNA formyltransferase